MLARVSAYSIHDSVQYATVPTLLARPYQQTTEQLYQNNNKVIDFILYFDTNSTKQHYDIIVVEFTLVSDGNGLSVTSTAC